MLNLVIKIKILILILLSFLLEVRAVERYEIKCDKCLFEKSIEIAIGEVGTREKTGKNDGNRIREYLSSVGLREGMPYCVAGLYWSFRVAQKLCQTKSQKPPQIPLERTGSSYLLFEKAKEKGNKTDYKAKRGDVIVWRNLSNYRTGHAERIVEVGKVGWCRTIAFNVENGVWIKQRNYLHPLSRMPLRGLIGFKI